MIAVEYSKLLAQPLDNRMERPVSVIGSATAFEGFVAPAHKRVLEFAYQARFANPGIADDPYEP